MFNLLLFAASGGELTPKRLDPNKKKIIVNDLRSKRPYIYLDDLIEALIHSIDNKKGVYNVGNGKSVSVEEIIRTTIEVTEIKKTYTSLNEERPNELFDMYAGILKISKAFRWHPLISFKDGISHYISSFNFKDDLTLK